MRLNGWRGDHRCQTVTGPGSETLEQESDGKVKLEVATFFSFFLHLVLLGITPMLTKCLSSWLTKSIQLKINLTQTVYYCHWTNPRVNVVIFHHVQSQISRSKLFPVKCVCHALAPCLFFPQQITMSSLVQASHLSWSGVRFFKETQTRLTGIVYHLLVKEQAPFCCCKPWVNCSSPSAWARETLPLTHLSPPIEAAALKMNWLHLIRSST